MSIVYKYDDTILTDTAAVLIRQSIVSLNTNADGTYATCEVEVLDLDGSHTFEQWHRWDVEETDDTVNPRCFTGRIVAVKVDRFGSRGVARRWNLTVQDINYRLHLRVFRSDDANRPAEVGSTRIAWLVGKLLDDGLAYDNGSVAPNDYDLPKADYRGRYADEVLGDIASLSTASPYTFFVYWDPVALQHSLFYGPVTSTTFDSILSISSVPGDAGDLRNPATTCYPVDSATAAALDGAGDEIYDGLYLTWGTGNHTYRQRPATFAATGIHRDGVVDNSRLTDQGAVDFYMTRWLEVHSGQVDTVTCVVRLPSSKVNRIDAGMRLSARFEQFPGWNPAVYSRVVKRGYAVPVEGQKKWYDVGLTLSTRGWKAGGGTGPPTGDFPHPPAGPPSLIQSAVDDGDVTWPLGAPTNGDLLMAWITERGLPTYPGTPSGWTSVATAKNTSIFGDNAYARLVTKIASGESAVFLNSTDYVATIMEWGGATFGAEVHQSDTGETGSTGVPSATPLTCGGAITPSAANAIVVGCGIVGTFGATTVAPDAGVTEIADLQFPGPNAPDNWVGYKAVTTPGSTTIGGIITGRSEFGGVTFTLLPSAASSPPAPSQWVYNEVPTPAPNGATSTFTTAFAFADGSLTVYVNKLDQTAAVTSYDGAFGDFTLAFAPWATDLVEVTYQGR